MSNIVAIVGRPNVGKSTLLNALLNEDRAIVSEIAGTTRDVIEDAVVIEGVQFRFIDTAGIRETEDKIEAITGATISTRAVAEDGVRKGVEMLEEKLSSKYSSTNSKQQSNNGSGDCKASRSKDDLGSTLPLMSGRYCLWFPWPK